MYIEVRNALEPCVLNGRHPAHLQFAAVNHDDNLFSAPAFCSSQASGQAVKSHFTPCLSLTNAAKHGSDPKLFRGDQIFNSVTVIITHS
ncbi:MAG: hypothetical protein AAB401_10090, partial [Acidobacteriota bacterium]